MCLFSFEMGNDVILMWVANLEILQGPWGLLLISHSRRLPQVPPLLPSPFSPLSLPLLHWLCALGHTRRT